MAKFDDSFFEGEIRNGFYIEPMVKRAWAAGIEVLEEIGKVCQKYNIQYFASWGTLLGAVRHNGFIPWDDDIDITMKREDLRKFLAVAKQELPEEYVLLNVHTEKDHTDLITRVVNSRYMNWGPERMEKYHDFPYVVGVDIFALDYVPREKEDEQFQCQLVSIVRNTLKNMITDPPVEPQIIDTINQIQAMCGVSFHQNSSIKNQLACLTDNLCGLYTEADGDKLSQIPDLANGWEYYVDKASYEKAIMMPFETIEIPVPVGYDQILRIMYGEFYMTPINRGSSHNYPFYKRQEFAMLSRLWQYRKANGIRYKVVFMPYKASMWDCLESIWRACSADETCECKVVPIPYYTYDKEKNEVNYCYEGEDFPADVEITDYREYTLSEELPHVIYIHNPYDDCNRTTSVAPEYFSKELKKYTHKLVYVPYYVTSGPLSPEHLNLPVYQNMDHMIVQSRQYKDGFLGLPHYDKMLDLGSPKLDRVIRMIEEGVMLPEEWKVDLAGKKAVLLNTSINCFLQDGELYLDKIRSVFETIKKEDDIVLVWRPHPLLRATLSSMRPQLVEAYDELVEEFKTKKIGVWDETPDITRVVAVTDAYIGDSGTSVINLYGVANKPIFILNNFIRHEFSEEEKRALPIVDMCTVGDEQWIISENNEIYVKEESWSNIISKEYVNLFYRWRGPTCSSMLSVGDRIYLAPSASIYFAYIDTKTKRIAHLPLSPLVKKWLFAHKMISYGEKLFCLTRYMESILEFDTIQMKWTVHDAGIKALKKCAKERVYEDALDWVADEQYLWVVASYTNTLLRLDMETGESVLVKVGEDGYGYSAIVKDGNCLWLAEVHTGALVVWNQKADEIVVHQMPKEFCCWKKPYGRAFAHNKLLSNEKYVFTIPGFSNSMVRINKVTRESQCVFMDFLKREDDVYNGFHAQYMPKIKYAGWFDEKTIWVQRAWDYKLAFLDVESNTCEEVQPAVSKDAMEEMLREKDIFIDKAGFECYGGTSMYYRAESRYFSLEGFLNDLCNGRLEIIKERQAQVMKSLAANIDGTCGEKVHQYIMGEFDRQIFKITDYV